MIQSQVTILNSLFHSFYFTYSQEVVVGILRFSPEYNVSNVSRCSRTKMPSPITFLPTRARRYASTAESSFRVRQTWTSMSERTTSSALTWSRRRTNFLEIKPLDKSVTISSKKHIGNVKEATISVIAINVTEKLADISTAARKVFTRLRKF